MKYFLHDTNARNDEKVTLLYIKYSYEGIGLFYSILEVLAAQEKPVSELVLKSQLKIRTKLEKQLNFMYKVELLSLKNGDVFNENLLSFSEKYQIKKEKTRKKVAEWRDKQQDIKDVTSYIPVSNHSKVKESKVKEISVKKFTPPTLIEVESYFKEKGFVGAKKAYDYYEVANWHDAQGNKIKNWKQKMQGVWFKDENKDKAIYTLKMN